MFIDTHYPPSWFDEHITLSRLRLDLHTGFHNTLAILETEGVAVYRLPFGSRFRYFIRRDAAMGIVRRHGSEAARKRRLLHSAAKAKGTPLWMACPHCGRKGRQWRSGLNTAGNGQVKCGHCKRFYTLTYGKRQPIQSTCPHCGAGTRQWRQQVTSAGNLTLRCGHCRRHYTVAGNPDAGLARPEPPVVRRPMMERIEW